MHLCVVLALAVAAPSRKVLEGKLIGVSRNGNWQAALSLIDELVENGHGTSTRAHNNAAVACSRAGRHVEALAVLESLRDRGGTWDSYSFTTAVTALGKRGQWQTALTLLKRMEESSSPSPNEFVYGAAIGACAVSSRWEDAIRLLDEMAQRGMPPTTRCYNGALAACDRAGQPDAALALLDRMRNDAHEGAWPSVVSYSTVLSALGRRPSLYASPKALELMTMMRADGVRPNAQTYGASVLAHGASGAWEAALEVLRIMDAEGVKPTDVVLCNILNACATGGAWQPALALVRGMEARYGISPDVACINAAIKACARGCEWRNAIMLLKSLGSRASERSYISALSALANGGRWSEALDLLKSMHADETSPIPSVRCYTAAIAACGMAKQWKEAVRLWAVLLTTVPRRADTEACKKVLYACYNAGQWRAALRVLEHLKAKDIKPVNAPPKGEAAAAVFGSGGPSAASDAVEAAVVDEAAAGAAGVHGVHRVGPLDADGATPLPTRVLAASERASATTTMGDTTRVLNRVCMLHDQLTRSGALDNAISFEAAIHACEKWGVGEQLGAILEALGEEYDLCVYEAERAAIGKEGAQEFEEAQLGVDPQDTGERGGRKRRPAPRRIPVKDGSLQVWETFD